MENTEHRVSWKNALKWFHSPTLPRDAAEEEAAFMRRTQRTATDITVEYREVGNWITAKAIKCRLCKRQSAGLNPGWTYDKIANTYTCGDHANDPPGPAMTTTSHA